MISYGDRVQGFLAIPQNQQGPFGAVVLGHERYGFVQHTLDLVAKFAAHGYVGLAPGMFSRWDGDKEALSRGDIRVSISDEEIRSYMGDSLDYRMSHKQVDPDRISAMGVCQSGDYPLILNSVRQEVAANIVVYGGAQARVWEVDEYRPKESEHAWSLILEFMERAHAGEFPKDRVVWRFQSDIAPDHDFTKKVRLA